MTSIIFKIIINALDYVPAVDLALPLREDGAVEALVAHVAGEAGLVPGAAGAAHQLRNEHLQRQGKMRWA